MHQFLEVKREGGGRYAKTLLHHSRCHPTRAGNDQRPEHLQPDAMRQGGQSIDNCFLFHISRIHEMFGGLQVLATAGLLLVILRAKHSRDQRYRIDARNRTRSIVSYMPEAKQRKALQQKVHHKK